MRWTDLPPDPGPADGRSSALPKGEWEELRRRLERLPDGHPSRPDEAAGTTTDEGEGLAAGDLAGEGSDAAGQPEHLDPGDDKPADPHRRARGPGGADAGHHKPGGLGDIGGRGAREPYRPWFAGGESPEPWFIAEAD